MRKPVSLISANCGHSLWLWKIYLPTLASETLHYWLRFDRKVNFPLSSWIKFHVITVFSSLPISLSHWTWIENFQSFHLINRESFPSLFFILLRNSLFYGQIVLFSSHKKIIIISSEFSRFILFAGVVSDYSVFFHTLLKLL